MKTLDTFHNFMAILSQLPIEKIFIHRPYIGGTPEAGSNIPQEIPDLESPVTTGVVDMSPAGVHDGVIPVFEYAGTSQISAAGKACIPCGNDHFSTASNLLAEARRFALRNKTLDHPEVIVRIAHAEDELNGFEREDGAAEKVEKLPPDEKELMGDMLVASGQLRHAIQELNATSSLDDLAGVGVLADRTRRDFRTRLFRMQMSRLSPAQQGQLLEKVKEITAITPGTGSTEQDQSSEQLSKTGTISSRYPGAMLEVR